MRKPILLAAVIAVAFLTSTVVTALAAQLTADPNASGDVAVRDIVHPLAPVTITQNTDPDTLVAGTSIACSDGATTTTNAWLRLFDLDGDHGLIGTYSVQSIDWGVESVIGSLDITVNVYCLDEGLPFLYAFMELKDSAAILVADELLTFHSTPIGGYCDTATEDMAIDLSAEDCNIAGCHHCFIGMNDLGQTAPTYIAAASCGVNEPTDLAGLGFPNAHLVMKVNGGDADDGGQDDDGGGDVPATTGVGAILLLLILLGTGAYFLRGRANREMRIPRGGVP
jgi:hypothetical protein